LHKDQKLFQ